MIEYSYSFHVRLRDGTEFDTDWQKQMATHDQTKATIEEHVHRAALADLQRAMQAGGLWDLGGCSGGLDGPIAVHPNQIVWVRTDVDIEGPETEMPPALAQMLQALGQGVAKAEPGVSPASS